MGAGPHTSTWRDGAGSLGLEVILGLAQRPLLYLVRENQDLPLLPIIRPQDDLFSFS